MMNIVLSNVNRINAKRAYKCGFRGSSSLLTPHLLCSTAARLFNKMNHSTHCIHNYATFCHSRLLSIHWEIVKPMLYHSAHISCLRGHLLIGVCLICKLSSFSIQYRMFNFSFNFSCLTFMLYCFYLRTSVAFFIKIKSPLSNVNSLVTNLFVLLIVLRSESNPRWPRRTWRNHAIREIKVSIQTSKVQIQCDEMCSSSGYWCHVKQFVY